MTTTNTHTAATLAALPPRELDALAHRVVMDKGYVIGIKGTMYSSSQEKQDPSQRKAVPHYSTSLDAAALLERELERRELALTWVDCLESVVGAPLNIHDLIPQDLLCIARSSARSRTIAAILAAQEAK